MASPTSPAPASASPPPGPGDAGSRLPREARTVRSGPVNRLVVWVLCGPIGRVVGFVADVAIGLYTYRRAMRRRARRQAASSR